MSEKAGKESQYVFSSLRPPKAGSGRDNNDQRASVGRFHHGIHLDRAYQNRLTRVRPPHLEVVRRWGRQCTRKQCRFILTSPNGINMEYALKSGSILNNEAEYEDFITGINLAHSMEADQLKVYNDS